MESQESTIEITTFIDICRMGGSFTAILSGIVVLAILIITVLGIRAKLKHLDSNRHSWWLSLIAPWILLFGVVGFVSDVIKSYMSMSTLHIAGAMELLTTNTCEALIKIMLTGFAALLGLTGAIITKQFGNKKESIR